jgi:6-pyruvoyltetrahydropterin/6-carboxytetrahydropterin synthase
VAPGTFRIALAKEDFKFSAAHFTLFGAGSAEALHGHNYRVAIEVSGRTLGAEGLLADFADLKALVRDLCRRLDDRILVPERSPHLLLARTDDGLEVRFGARRYLFPEDEVVLLPFENSSLELLAGWLWRELAPALPAGLAALRVEVEESDGQSASYESSLA